MLAAMNVGKREEVAGEGQPATVNSVKPTGTVKPSATSCQLNPKKRMAQLIGNVVLFPVTSMVCQ